MPRRDYWLAPERRRNTFEFIFAAGIWLANLSCLFLLGLQLFVVAANTLQPPQLSQSVWLLNGAFLVSVALWTILLIGRFMRAS
jgi:serine/threonine-protein kinase